MLASAALQLDQVLAAERDAEQVALSLGQRERVGSLVEEVQALRADLAQHADARARALLTPRVDWIGRVRARMKPRSAVPARRMGWEAALREARRTARSAADCLATLGASVPDQGAEAVLVQDVRALLRRHGVVLSNELARWKSEGGSLAVAFERAG